MLTRRAFNLSLLMSCAISALAADPVAAETRDPDEVLLNRLTFGATAEERRALARLGQDAWLADQIDRPAHDAAIDARLAAQTLRMRYDADDDGEGHGWPGIDELRPLSSLRTDPGDLLVLVDWETPMSYAERIRPADEVIAAALTRAVHAPAQLREVLTQFWHDHFNVHSQKDEFVAVFFPQYDAGLRRHALGNFRTLLGHVAKSPSMLVYLNNADSRASPANENWARELLELHTLGAGNYLNDHANRWSDVPMGADGHAVGYIDEDVYEVARAFTGWTIGDGRYVSDGVATPKTGLFHYVEAWHDPYQKRILGREFPPNRAPLADGEDILDMLAAHPGTAQFICTKIARRLLADDPDATLVDRLVAVFLGQADAPDQIAQVIRALVADPAFATPPTKLRRPFEFMAAIYRASGATIDCPDNAFHWQLSRMGWMQHTLPPPNGHPDRTDDWATSTVLIRQIEMALYAHDDWFGVTRTRLGTDLPKDVQTIGDLAAHWVVQVQGNKADRLPELFSGLDRDPAEPLPDDADERHDLSVAMLAFAVISPQFMWR